MVGERPTDSGATADLAVEPLPSRPPDSYRSRASAHALPRAQAMSAEEPSVVLAEGVVAVSSPTATGLDAEGTVTETGARARSGHPWCWQHRLALGMGLGAIAALSVALVRVVMLESAPPDGIATALTSKVVTAEVPITPVSELPLAAPTVEPPAEPSALSADASAAASAGTIVEAAEASASAAAVEPSVTAPPPKKSVHRQSRAATPSRPAAKASPIERAAPF